MISMREQKKIAVKMWQYIKAQIMQHEPIFSITHTKCTWLRHNYPNIHWKYDCILCDSYMHPLIADDCFRGIECRTCPLSKKYKERASYGCSMEEDTPWSRIVNYDVDEKAAVEACDEIIEAIESLQGGEEFS